MASHVKLIAFGTFGNPNGFKQNFFGAEREELVKFKLVKTFDLNTNAIKLFPNSKIYSIRKEYAAGFNSISYSLYTYAKEQNSERSGTFIGSGLLFIEKIADEALIINQLNEFHSNLILKNVKNDVILVNHSEKFIVSKPRDFDKLEYHLKEIENLNFAQNTDKTLVVFSPTTNEILSKLFSKSIDLLNVYDTIYFTDNREVAEFVNQKGIFKIIQNVSDKLDFEQEIQNLLEERRRKREQSISDFEREVQILNDDKLKTINEFKIQIEQNEKVHKENEIIISESKKELDTIEIFYKEFTLKIQDLVNQVKSGKKLEDVKQLYIENRNRFIDGLNTLKRPDYINKLPKINPKSNLRPDYNSQKFENTHRKHRHESEELKSDKKIKIDIYKVATLFLFIFLILTWTYFLFFNDRQDEPINDNQEMLSQPAPVQEETKSKSVTLEHLNPAPNSELNENDYRLIAKKLVYNSRVQDIVKIIFENNPSEIKSYYSGQDSIYMMHLLELNKNCFEVKDGITYFYRDTLRHIPSLKK